MSQFNPEKQLQKHLERGYAVSVRYLGYRARSINEMKNHLKKKGFDAETVSSVIKILMDKKFLNDRAFARAFIEERQRVRPKSRFALTYELRQKGISDSIIEESVLDVNDHDSAMAAVKLKNGIWKQLDRETYKKKVMNFLKNRGFNYEVSISIFLTRWEEKETGGTGNENQIF